MFILKNVDLFQANLILTWYYNRIFSCVNKDVLYVLTCNKCDFLDMGQIEELKQGTGKLKKMWFILITVTVKDEQDI